MPSSNNVESSHLGTNGVRESNCDTSAGGKANKTFLHKIVADELKSNKHVTVVTRFPPEPNGYLHLGHAKSIHVNFGLAKLHHGHCNLRFDDTNPCAEKTEFIESIKGDVAWLGGDWGGKELYASDYFPQFHQWAVQLIQQGDAYVDSQTPQEVQNARGSLIVPGIDSPFRTRSIQESLRLFAEMKDGKHPENFHCLRAKIDMTSPNMNFRDPIIYRILHKTHPRTRDQWCIYPTYDFAHGQSDSIEAITHSICTLEFELHRPLYEWFQEKLGILRTRQIEFARLNMTYVLMSKRKLLTLVEEGYVSAWDDPRMPTLAGLRRRGVPPAAIHDFCERIGIARRENLISISLLESCIRDNLDPVALRFFALKQPLKITLNNYTSVEPLSVPRHPINTALGSRTVNWQETLYIDRSDFAENPPKGFKRLIPGGEVRLRRGYWIRCEKVHHNPDGSVASIECSVDLTTRGGIAPADGRKVKGTIPWLSEGDSSPAELRIYSYLFTEAEPEKVARATGDKWTEYINKESLQVCHGLVCKESIIASHSSQEPIQFERIGFFAADSDSRTDMPIFNLVVSLVDSYTASQPNSEATKIKKERENAVKKAALERSQRKQTTKKKVLDDEICATEAS